MTRMSDREKATPPATITTTLLLAISILSSVAQAGVLDRRIATSYDDAEQRANGSISRGDSDLEMVFDKGGNQTVGVRFPDLTIPRGATVTSAWIQFTTDEKSTTPTALVIDAAAADTTKPFKTTRFSISNLPRTTAKANWNPQAWNVVGESAAAQRTPDLSPIIGEIINRPGWASGNAITLVVAGTGERVAESYNGDAAAAPLLHVEFTGGINMAPSVDAGADINITLPQNAVALDATV
ncbi:MAG TPA: RTX toxin, partial [Gammaproteobacteria bacterium]|nr:RTX toxin [Gammaproteobacteria bacterium]